MGVEMIYILIILSLYAIIELVFKYKEIKLNKTSIEVNEQILMELQELNIYHRQN